MSLPPSTAAPAAARRRRPPWPRLGGSPQQRRRQRGCWPRLDVVRAASLLILTSLPPSEALAAARGWKPVPAEWFSPTISEAGESSLPESGAGATWGGPPERDGKIGWTPKTRLPADGKRRAVKGKRWFHESDSGGYKEAWQTHFPAVKNTFQHSRPWRVLGHKEWEYTPEGWLQDPRPDWLVERMHRAVGAKDADWFDAATAAYDIYGRAAPPPEDSPRYLMAMPEEPKGNVWKERSVNTTLTCGTPGCNGTAALQAYDPSTEEARNCRLNILVHPTDFDDEWSKEPIELWTVNGFSVRGQCDPVAKGCNATAARPLYSCLSEMKVDHIIDPQKGYLSIFGQLNKMVDECPYQGNYLSAVPQVTCLVRYIPEYYETANGKPPEPTIPPSFGGVGELKEISVAAELHCSTPGCKSSTKFHVDPTMAVYGGVCLMNVTLAQTDFDDAVSNTEFVEFLSFQDRMLSSNLQPGKNPCNAAFRDASADAPSGENYTLKVDMDVTDDVINGFDGEAGAIRLEGKISDMVDECGSRGQWLLDVFVEVRCTPPATLFNATLRKDLPAARSGGPESAAQQDGPVAQAASRRGSGSFLQVKGGDAAAAAGA